MYEDVPGLHEDRIEGSKDLDKARDPLFGPQASPTDTQSFQKVELPKSSGGIEPVESLPRELRKEAPVRVLPVEDIRPDPFRPERYRRIFLPPGHLHRIL